jgi:hypothetical protein
MQLTAAAVTPPAEHAAHRSAGAAGAAAADAGGRLRELMAVCEAAGEQVEKANSDDELRGRVR